MGRRLATFTALAYALLCASVAEAQIERKSKDSQLAGLGSLAVHVNVNPLDDTKSESFSRLMRQPKILPESIKTRVEVELRRSTGLRILERSSVTPLCKPRECQTLVVDITVIRLAENNTNFALVQMWLDEPVRIERNGALIGTQTWSAPSASYAWGGDDAVLNYVVDQVDLLTKHFLNGYLASNP